MAKKFLKTRTNLVFKKVDNKLIPINGDFEITYRKNVEDEGILPNGTPVIREMGKWVIL